MAKQQASAKPTDRRQFKIGKYDIIAQPASGSAHMLRYTVMLNGKRLGALLSVPTESDCRFLEAPPKVPPLKIFQVTYRPGRPKKNAQTNSEEAGPTIPWSIKGQQRY
ncbi:MAG TPA: hypothetical protein VFC18_00895 [Burkholderiales bacterium]|nr:hypothetical protein [Burkholderiales bacterium]